MVGDRLISEESMTFVLKIEPPDPSCIKGDDVYLAETLAKAVRREGHPCHIHNPDEWGKDDLDVDVVIHLKGLSEYHPKPWNVNLMWIDRFLPHCSDEELSRYDAVIVNAKGEGRRLDRELAVPLFRVPKGLGQNHSDLASTDGIHFRRTQTDYLSAVEFGRATGDLARRDRNQLQNGLHRHRFAAAGFTYHAQGFALANPVTDAPHGLDGSAVGGELHLEIFHVQDIVIWGIHYSFNLIILWISCGDPKRPASRPPGD